MRAAFDLAAAFEIKISYRFPKPFRVFLLIKTMQTLDLVIIFGYLIGITLFGIFYSGKQETTADYFVGDRSVPWWAISASIVATETSTITFISVPGIAFAKNGNF